MFLIIILYMVLAISFTFSKAALSYSQPIFFTAVRMIGGGLSLLVYAYFRNQLIWGSVKKKWWLFAQLVLFHVYIPYIFYFFALQHMISSKVALFFNLSTFFTAFFAYYFFGQTLSWQQWLGICIGFFGVAPMVVVGNVGQSIIPYFSWAEYVLLFSVISSTYGWTLMKHLVADTQCLPSVANGISMFVGGFFALITSYVVEGVPKISLTRDFTIHALQLPWSDVSVFIFYTILTIILVNLCFYNLYGMLLKTYSTVFLSLMGLLTPLLVAFWSWALVGEKIPDYFFVSLAFLCFGLFIFYSQELTKVKKTIGF